MKMSNAQTSKPCLDMDNISSGQFSVRCLLYLPEYGYRFGVYSHKYRLWVIDSISGTFGEKFISHYEELGEPTTY